MQTKSPFSKALKDGIILLLPFGITLGLIYWAWSLLRKFIPDFSPILPTNITNHPYLDSFLDLLSLLFILFIILIFGMLASTVLGKFMSMLIDKLLMKPTFVRPIYTTFKKLATSIFSTDTNSSFTKGISDSILIPYPNSESKSIGFVTSNHARHLLGDEEGDKWLTVYVPSAPVVSAGFYLLCKKEDTSPCKLLGTKAITTIISVGAVQDYTSTANSANNPILEELPIQKPNIIRVWFLNGILFLTPFSATVAILSWAFNHIYHFISTISNILPYSLKQALPEQYYVLILNTIITVILIISVMIIGFLGESAFGIWAKSFSHKIFNSIPMLNKVYNIVEQITKVFSPDPSKNSNFDKAVLVPFPTKSTYAVGFMTGKDSSYITNTDADISSPVFIPTTPIPTTGWFIIAKNSDLIKLDIPVEKAFGLVISAGILTEEE